MNQPDDVLRGIRQKILTGVIPKENCRMTWYGPGTGGVCVACEQPIAANEVEVECDVPNGATIRLHQGCHDVWARVRHHRTMPIRTSDRGLVQVQLPR